MNASSNGTEVAITPAQSRAARAFLNWSQEQLAEVSGVPKRTVVRFERGEGIPQQRTIAAIRITLETVGIEFIAENGGGPGVRLRTVAPETST